MNCNEGSQECPLPIQVLYHTIGVTVSVCFIYTASYKVTWGNSVKMTSERYNFTSTLAIEMYLGKHNAYSILNTWQAC